MEEGGASKSTAAEGSSSGGEKIWCLERVGRDSGWLRLAENTEVTLGRGLDVTYQILSPKCPLMISRKHCLFRQNSEGHWTVVDKTSLNGVWVNGERIPPEKARTLSRGDSIQLGVAVDGMQVEFQYVLVQDFLQTLQPFLSDGLPKEQALESMPRKTKRKFSVEEASTPLDSQSKLYRCSTTDKSRGRSCPIAVPLQASPAAQDAAGPSRASLDAGRSHALTDCSSELACLQQHNQNMQAIRSRMLEVEQRAASLQAEGPDRPRETDELLQELSVLRSQLHCQQEAQVRRVKMLEKSFYEEEKRLEMEKKQEQEDSLKKQLETTLLEHRKLIEELRLSRQGFEEILQAKDKELEETKEEKEKARAQREEVVTQMTEVLENELQCIICSELFIEAVTLNCAHSFCQHCIREWRKRRDECPICRQAIASQTRSLVLDNCIDRMVEKLGAAMQQHRLALVREREATSARSSFLSLNGSGGASSESSSLSPAPSLDHSGSLSPLPSLVTSGSLSPVPSTVTSGSLSPVPSTVTSGSLSPVPSTVTSGSLSPVPSLEDSSHVSSDSFLEDSSSSSPVPSLDRSSQSDVSLTFSEVL